jgi:alpha-1,2-mannosyltransferase
MALYSNYSAPMIIYKHFYNEYVNSNGTLCLGKEWHRFPSHYFIPDGVSVSYTKSHFTGLLPKLYDQELEGWRSGTWHIPEGMNDLNREEMDRYVEVDVCDFMIDVDFSGEGEEIEPVYRKDVGRWSEDMCLPFLDAGRTRALSRVFWMPYLVKDERVWGQYCLLKRVE